MKIEAVIEVLKRAYLDHDVHRAVGRKGCSVRSARACRRRSPRLSSGYDSRWNNGLPTTFVRMQRHRATWSSANLQYQ